MLLHCFLIYQDSMLSYLIKNGELYSTYKGGTPSTRGRSSNWPPPTPPPVTQDATLVISLDTLKLRLNAKRTVSHWDVRVSALLPVDWDSKFHMSKHPFDGQAIARGKAVHDQLFILTVCEGSQTCTTFRLEFWLELRLAIWRCVGDWDVLTQ